MRTIYRVALYYPILESNLNQNFSVWLSGTERFKSGAEVFYYVKQNSLIDTNNYKSEIEEAFNKWEIAIFNDVDFTLIDDENKKDEAHITIDAGPLCWDGNCGTLAKTTHKSKDDEVISVKVIFNTNVWNRTKYWIEDASNSSKYCSYNYPESSQPFLRIALHEFGHVLGLPCNDELYGRNYCSSNFNPCNCKHECNASSAIMFYDGSETYPLTSLFNFDVNAVRQLYGFDPVKRGLVAYYPLNKNAEDRIGGHDGNNNPNNPNNEVEFIDNAASFNGTNYIEVPASSDFDLQTYTISAWVKPNWGSMTTTNCVVGHGESRSDKMQYSLLAYMDSNNDRTFRSWFEDSSDRDYRLTHVPKTYTNNDWYFVAATRDSSGNYRLYIRDEYFPLNMKCLSDTPNPPSIFHPLQIGVRTRDGNRLEDFFNGMIDEVRIHNYALAKDQIQEIYNLGR